MVANRTKDESQEPRKMISSPSSRKVRLSPVGRRMGRAPLRVSSRRQPAEDSAGPEMVPVDEFVSVLEYSIVPPASSMVPAFVGPTASMMMSSPVSTRMVPAAPLLRPAVKRPVPSGKNFRNQGKVSMPGIYSPNASSRTLS